MARQQLQSIVQGQWTESPYITVRSTVKDLNRPNAGYSRLLISFNGDTLYHAALSDVRLEEIQPLIRQPLSVVKISENPLHPKVKQVLNPINQQYTQLDSIKIFYSSLYRTFTTAHGDSVYKTWDYLDSFKQLLKNSGRMGTIRLDRPFITAQGIFLSITMQKEIKEQYLGFIDKNNLGKLQAIWKLSNPDSIYPLTDLSFYVSGEHLYTALLQSGNDSLVRAQKEDFRILGKFTFTNNQLKLDGFTEERLHPYFVENNLGIYNSFPIFPTSTDSEYTYGFTYYPAIFNKGGYQLYDQAYLDRINLRARKLKFRPYKCLAIHKEGSDVWIIAKIRSVDYLIWMHNGLVIDRIKLARHRDLTTYSMNSKQILVFIGRVIGSPRTETYSYRN
ncbi:MAG TPA: hypothetical protein VFV37_01350 [Luteibaculaceae bacterium]|nr:hypothetical protein [Luteibaculaceae bacterium]